MSDGSPIQWTDATVNPVPGCRRISEGCGTHEGGCYAEKMAWRLAHNPATPQYHGTVRWSAHGPRWTGVVGWAPSELDKVRAWKKPRRIFVESMGDLFFEGVNREHLDLIFETMEACPRHTFQVLSKRPDRMADYVGARYGEAGVPAQIWLGTSVEHQAAADERIPHLLRCKARVLWLSCEPLLGPLDLATPGRYTLDPDHHHRAALMQRNGRWGTCSGCPRDGTGMPYPERCEHAARHDHHLVALSWVVVGGESGRKAREFDVAWARSIVAQCRAAGVAVFVKQLGVNPQGLPERDSDAERAGKRRLRVLDDSHGGDPGEWPEDMRVREFPRGER